MNRLGMTICSIVLAGAFGGVLGQKGEKGSLRTLIDPMDAGVFVDGQYRGSATMFVFSRKPLDLQPGIHEVELVDPRCKPSKMNAEIKPGIVTTIRHSMECTSHVSGPFGELATAGWSNAAIYLNNQYYGNTGDGGILIGPGTYDLKIVPVDGSQGREGKITINVDETLLLTKGAADVRRK